MLKFIKLIPIIVLTVLVTACYYDVDTYKFFDFQEFFYDDQGDLVSTVGGIRAEQVDRAGQ